VSIGALQAGGPEVMLVALVAVVALDVVEVRVLDGVVVLDVELVRTAVTVFVVELPHAASDSASATSVAVRAKRSPMRQRSCRPRASPADRPLMAPSSQGGSMDTPGERLTAEAERAEQRMVREGETFGTRLSRRDPYWAPQLVVLGALVLDYFLPEKLTIGPNWLLPAVELMLLAGLVLAAPSLRSRHPNLRRSITVALIALVSIVNIVSLGLLVHYLVHGGKSGGRELIGAGLLLWLTNVLLFGLWYWELDRGGPFQRSQHAGRRPDFLFPQMTDSKWAPPNWMPGLIDYMYVSFTNATAFSPTDTMPMTPWAKVLMTAQSLTALVTVGLVVARAVNILGP
jgi:hypothetical protein